jgi:uncharacterized delta-60 repeat protein
MKKIYFLATAILSCMMILIGTAAANAQTASLDSKFKPAPGIDANKFVYSVALQPDGKILIGGNFTTYNGTARNRIARLNADGSLDASFNLGSGVEGSNSLIYSIAVQPDGKILIGGNFTSYDGTAINNIARLNTDGSLDTSFNLGTGANSYLQSVAVQLDGKILIGGNFTTYNGTAINRIARLNTDGSLDTSFDPGSGADNSVYSFALQPDGKIFIGGFFTTYNGTAINRIARLNADGSLDTSFDPGSGPNTYPQGIALQSDGKILIGGGFKTYNGAEANQIARLNTDGSLDTSFSSGTGFSSGSGPNGGQLAGSISSIVLHPNGKIIVGGSFIRYLFYGVTNIAILNTDGSFDTSMGTATPNSRLTSLALQPDGKVLIGGAFTAYNSTVINGIARIVFSTLGVSESGKAKFSIFPNPVKDVLQIESGKLKVENAKIFDMQGKLVKTFNGNSVNVSGLPKGMYMLEMNGKTEKFIKE